MNGYAYDLQTLPWKYSTGQNTTIHKTGARNQNFVPL